MKYTSAQAGKEIKKLTDSYSRLLEKEEASSVFNAAMGENAEAIRPEYDYDKTQSELAVIEEKIRKLKHALNVFNATHKVPGWDMTVDEMLVYIPQLNKRKIKLTQMASRIPRSRVSSAYMMRTNIVDYTITNYDIAKAEADCEKVSDELARAQNALDLFNSTETFEL